MNVSPQVHVRVNLYQLREEEERAYFEYRTIGAATNTGMSSSISMSLMISFLSIFSPTNKSYNRPFITAITE